MSKPQIQNIFKVVNGAKKPTILMSGFIGKYSKVNSDDVQKAIAKFEEAGETDVDILINSGGGSTIDGLTIGDFLALSPIKFHGIVIGMAASMAGGILMFCDKRSAYKNARIMTHKVQGGDWGESDRLRSTADLIDQEEEKIIAQFVTATGLPEKTVKTWFKSGVNKWFTSKDALKNGLITNIIEPPKPIKIDNSITDELELINAYESATEDLYPNPQNNSNTDTTIMKKSEIIAMLIAGGLADNLTSNATDEQLSEVLQNVINNAANTKKYKTQLDEFLKSNGETLLNQAVKDGKLTKAEVPEWLEEYKSNPKMTAKAVAKMAGKPDLNNGLEQPPRNEDEPEHKLLKGREEWTFDKWQDEAPEDLETLHDEAPKAFEAIFNKKYDK